ncbi:MAG: carbonic anhydrase [Acidimicrobiales bacterium]|nr:carbonic anhydrase [Acidimicrobiales bacterium]
MHVLRDLLEANHRYHQGFRHAGLLPPPRKGLAVLTCMDCRIDTASVFGLLPGDAHVVRNAGARATDDALRSLVLSTVRLGVSRIAVVHHTNCGAIGATDDEVRTAVLATTGHDPAEAGLDLWLAMDEKEALDDDVARIAGCRFLPTGTLVAGFLYDVETGLAEPATPILAVGSPTPIGALE